MLIVFSLLFTFSPLVPTVGAEANPAGKGKGNIPVDIMSYNIHHGVGIDTNLNLERITDVIRNNGAEIIGLQEVDKSNKFEGPSVLMGDFNTTPETAEIQKLLTESLFIDSFSGIDAPYTFPVLNPIKQIDYIFTSDFLLFNNQHTEASDYLPVITTIELSKVRTVSYQGIRSLLILDDIISRTS